MAVHSIGISLRDPSHLFSCTGVDPTSVDYDEFAIRPAIEMVRDTLVADPPPGDDTVELAISLPRDRIHIGLDAELTAAVRRWARAESTAEAQRSSATWAAARRMTVVVVALFALVQFAMVSIRRVAIGVDNDIVAAIAEGVSVVGWVLLWFPIDSYLLERARRVTRRRLSDVFDRVEVSTRPFD